MVQEVWQWVLEAMPDEELVELARGIKVQVQGFRTISKSNIKSIRHLVVHGVARKVARLKQIPEKKGINHDEIRGKTLSELQMHIDEGADLVETLLALLTSPEQDDRSAAELLFTQLRNSGDLDKLREGTVHDRTEQQEIELQIQRNDEMSRLVQELEKKLDASQKKVEKVRVSLAAEQQSHSETKRKLTADKGELQKELNNLQAERKLLEQEVAQLNDERTKWLEERSSLIERVDKLTLEARQAKGSENKSKPREAVAGSTLADALSRLDLSEITSKDKKSTQSAQSGTRKVKIPTVGLIGKETNPNKEAANTLKYQIHIINSNSIERVLSKDSSLSIFEEVWLLTYETTTKLQRMIERAVSQDRLKVFRNHSELVQFLNR